jgi:hypothetical protein
VIFDMTTPKRSQNSERRVSQVIKEQIYDIVVIGSGPSGRELFTFHKKMASSLS